MSFILNPHNTPKKITKKNESELKLKKSECKWESYCTLQVEGLLKVKEHAGRGTMTTMVCGETLALWSKDVDEWPCPCSLPFSVALPTVFSDERGSWVCDLSLPAVSSAARIRGVDWVARILHAVHARASRIIIIIITTYEYVHQSYTRNGM